RRRSGRRGGWAPAAAAGPRSGSGRTVRRARRTTRPARPKAPRPPARRPPAGPCAGQAAGPAEARPPAAGRPTTRPLAPAWLCNTRATAEVASAALRLGKSFAGLQQGPLLESLDNAVRGSRLYVVRGYGGR